MSRIIEFRKAAQKAEKQSVQGKTCAFTGHRPQSLPFGFDESDKRCTSLKSVMRGQEVTTRNLHKKVSFIFNPSRAGLQMQALAHLLVQV